MRIAVLGTGGVGRAHAAALRSLGHDVALGSRDASPVVDDATDRVLRYADAVSGADLVINAVNGAVAVEVLTGLADALAGVVVLDLTNPLDFSGGRVELFVCNTDSLGERIQRAVPAARIVKSLCTTNVEVQVDPRGLGAGQHDMFVAGDDAAAKAVVADLLRGYGWARVVDVGDITAARGLEMMIPMWLLLSQALGTARFNYRLVTDEDPAPS